MPQKIEFGLDTFGDVTAGPDGKPQAHAPVIREVIEQAVLADRLGIEAFGVGEHHRPDFAISAPEVVLAAIAGRTNRILLGSAVTVLSSDDPVRVFERFSTLNAASSGRAEITVGRGSFTESFPLFGFDMGQYETLFEEKLDLFVALIRNEAVTWTGTTRSPLTNQRVFPPLEGGELKTWIGVGGSPESVVRAARYDLPLMLAIIGGDPKRFTPYVDLYHRAFVQLGKPAEAHSARTYTVMSPTPISRRATSCGRITRQCATASAPSAAGRRRRGRISIPKPTAARSIAARRKLSRGALPRPQKRSALPAST